MRLFTFCLLLIISVLFITGCAPRDVVKEDEEDAFADELREYEREFDPSEYNAPFAIKKDEDTDPEESTDYSPERDEPDARQIIQGFRIQLYSTSDMETAREVHELADSLFTDHWVYVVYEVPFYKVRLGDFETRPIANRVLTSVIREGFRDAWIVPDRVIKDPPEKLFEKDDDEIDDDEEFEVIIDPPGG